MKILKRLIKEVLLEDRASFLAKIANIEDYDGTYMDSSYDAPEVRKPSKEIKRIWYQNADHTFMRSLITVHWLSASKYDLLSKFMWFVNNPGKDEISTMAYLPGEDMKSLWGRIGVQLTGRVTLASNDMDSIYSGYHEDRLNDNPKKYASSGVPKRPGIFNQEFAKDYILDKASYSKNKSDNNEFIVDNWKLKSLVLSLGYDYVEGVIDVINAAKQAGIPCVNYAGQPIDYKDAMKRLTVSE